MSVTRTERLLNLVIALLAARTPLARSTIQGSVAGYDPDASVAAFERMFERDKDELRAMGIPVTTEFDAHGDVQGYLIDEKDYAQRDIDLSVDELAVISVAARVWDEAVLAPAALTALRKIEAAGPFEETVETPQTFASVSASDAALLPLMRAIRENRAVRFEYAKPGDATPKKRFVEPWMVRSIEGHWYLNGWDRDRSAERIFRLSRITSPVTLTAQTFEPQPHGQSVATAVDADEEIQVTLLIPPGVGAELQRLPGTQHVGAETWSIRAPKTELTRLLWRADPRIRIVDHAGLVESVAVGFETIAQAHA